MCYSDLFKRISVSLLSITLMAFVSYGCSSDSDEPDVTQSQPENVDSGILSPEAPAQVSFLGWESPENCPDGTMPVINKEGCQDIGNACPEGDWPADLEMGADNLYVQVGGTGDGLSTDSPMGAITDALAAAGPDTTIVLAKGTYNEEFAINS